MRITSKTCVTIYRWEKDGLMPKRAPIGGGSVNWRMTDIDDWMANKDTKAD